MCEPISAMTAFQQIGLAISAVSAVSNFVSQSDQASRTEAANRANYDSQVAATQQQQAQITAQASDQMSARAKAAQAERGRLAVVGAESGLAGGSSDRAFLSTYTAEATDIATIEGNRRSAVDQSQRQLEGLRATGQGRINSIKQPSLIGAGLQIAGGYFDQASKMPGSRSTVAPLTDAADNLYG